MLKKEAGTGAVVTQATARGMSKPTSEVGAHARHLIKRSVSVAQQLLRAEEERARLLELVPGVPDNILGGCARPRSVMPSPPEFHTGAAVSMR